MSVRSTASVMHAQKVMLALVALSVMGCQEPSSSEVAVQAAPIWNGSVQQPGDMPFQVHLGSMENPHICGGALLSEEWFITAAHCVYGVDYEALIVTLGEGQRSVNEGSEQVRGVELVFFHPQARDYFQGGNFHRYDAALVKLDAPVELNEYVQPVSVWPIYDVADAAPATASGWGRTQTGLFADTLMAADLNTVPRSSCATTWAGMLEISNAHLCALGTNPLRNIRHGDSGGPLVVYIDGPVLIGITTNTNHNDPSWPGVFANLGLMHGWIEEVVFNSMWILPAADAQVRGGDYANTNFGSDTTSWVKNSASASNDRELYMKFDLTGVPTSIAQATLWQTVRRSSGSGANPTVHLRQLYSSGETWSEGSLTWNNRYESGRTMQSQVFSNTSAVRFGWSSAELTARVAQEAAGIIAFRQSISAGTTEYGVIIETREAANIMSAPILQVRLE